MDARTARQFTGGETTRGGGLLAPVRGDVERSLGYLEHQLPVSIKLVVDYGGRVPLLKNERGEWELP